MLVLDVSATTTRVDDPEIDIDADPDDRLTELPPLTDSAPDDTDTVPNMERVLVEDTESTPSSETLAVGSTCNVELEREMVPEEDSERSAELVTSIMPALVVTVPAIVK